MYLRLDRYRLEIARNMKRSRKRYAAIYITFVLGNVRIDLFWIVPSLLE